MADSTNPFDEPITEDEKNPFFENVDEKASKVGDARTSAPKNVGVGVDLEPNLTPFNGLISQCFEPYLVPVLENIFFDSPPTKRQNKLERLSRQNLSAGSNFQLKPRP